MRQQEIDPTQLGTVMGEVDISVLPPSVRKFGHVPDFRRCRPGDVILSRDCRPGMNGKAIRLAQQQAGFASEHFRWTHAAIYLEDTFVVEAVPRGVTQRTLYMDIPDRILRVRRWQARDPVDPYRVAIRALRMLGTPYSVVGAMRTGRLLLGGLWQQRSLRDLKGLVICSQVFYDAHADVTRSPLAGCPVDAPVTPAHLSASADLSDVEVPWMKVH